VFLLSPGGGTNSFLPGEKKKEAEIRGGGTPTRFAASFWKEEKGHIYVVLGSRVEEGRRNATSTEKRKRQGEGQAAWSWGVKSSYRKKGGDVFVLNPKKGKEGGGGEFTFPPARARGEKEIKIEEGERGGKQF